MVSLSLDEEPVKMLRDGNHPMMSSLNIGVLDESFNAKGAKGLRFWEDTRKYR